jgi:hypothetical protein
VVPRECDYVGGEKVERKAKGKVDADLGYEEKSFWRVWNGTE